MRLLLKYFLLALILGTGFMACETEPDPGGQLQTWGFSIDTLNKQIVQALEGQVAGYQYVISRNGNLVFSGEGGNSTYSPDPGGDQGMKAGTRMNIASVSKFIAAIALLQVLDKNNISLNEKIHDFLPPRWKASTHRDHFENSSALKVTFRKLLRMETGIAFPPAGNGSWSPGIMTTNAQMQAGLSSTGDATRVGVYQNGNFCLVRVLIGEIEYNLDEANTNYAQNCADKYYEYLNQNVFSPIGINNVEGFYKINNPPRRYQWPINFNFSDGNGDLGSLSGDFSERNGGSGGLRMSALQIAQVAAFTKHDPNQTLLKDNMRDSLLSAELGLTESVDGQYGRYKMKIGGATDDSFNRHHRAIVIFYPNGVELSFVVNSPIGPGSIARLVYDNSWGYF